MKLSIKKIQNDAVIPTRAHHDDAGVDLYAYGEHCVLPGQTMKIPTGIAMQIEEGCVGLIWDKSSIGGKGIKVMGGVIDAGYRGEILIVMHNLTDTAYTFEHGHKVAQMLIQKVEFPVVEEVEFLDETVRGDSAFGSTGK
jgi:dUTP pyrophosphatase